MTMTVFSDGFDHPARILVVDDDSRNSQLLGIMLAPEGCDVVTASSGDEALAMVAARPPDLILLDVLMSGIDGYEVATRLKADPATRNIPVIMVTALDDRDARMRGLNAGAEDFLSKPIDRVELRVRVRNLLRLKAYADSQEKYGKTLEEAVASCTSDLRRERDRAQRYLDTADVILLALDMHGRITLVNRYACSLLGWNANELIGRDWAETCLPARIRGFVRERFQALVVGDASVVENPILTRSGGERLIEWHNTVLRDDADKVIGTLSSGVDLTERNQALASLRTVEERMRFALESANIGIWDHDYLTGRVEWSAILEAQYGMPPGGFGGTVEAFAAAVHPDDRDLVFESMRVATERGSDFGVEHRVIRPDGVVAWVNLVGRIYLGEDGEPRRSVGISMDVTERRTLERKYRQAQKMEAVGRLASGVAHDFNNLLTVILGFTELVATDATTPSLHAKDLAEIRLAAERATGLTTQLLAFSRQQVLHTVPLDANQVIGAMQGMLSKLIREDVQIIFALAPDLAQALADRGQLEQVVMNLVVNAGDAMPDGGRLTITTANVDLETSPFHEEEIVPGSYVMVAVTDTGVGMSKETQRSLFEPFFTTKEVGRGTGLGLSTTYGIVKQSKGHIWVYSEIGIGTTFKVFFPCSGEAARPGVAGAPVDAPESRATETVLLVEDEAAVRQLSRRLLEAAGYKVLEAANGEHAEQVFAAHPGSIELVVTDMVMPACGGPELIRRLKLRAPDLKVLYMSGYADQILSGRAGIDASSAFLQKPFTSAEFRLRVRRALDGASPTAPETVVSTK